ncbi:MAG: agmatinase [Dictyoglomus sp.]|nr:agmatinase [Dictyoglomus sp.]MCX7941732.1 agmatinase [Dictyoglomaceae bacterium]MDW8189025.1 agmatinase [Dictyoglomus sp.]
MEQVKSTPSFAGLPNISFEEAQVIIIPISYEVTTSYKKGTRDGPIAILNSSYNIELYDEELDTIPAEIGIYTYPEPLLPIGDLKLPLECIKEIASKIIDSKKFPIFLGGEHTITRGILSAYIEKFFTDDLSVLHLDAHCDLREEYEGTSYHHACALRMVAEKLPLIQVGIRSLSKEEKEFINGKDNIKIFWNWEIKKNNNWIEEVITSLKDKVYITLDLDVFDPSIMPSVGTPEPGGLDWWDVLELLRKVFEKKKVLGVDIVELSPIPGLVYPDYLVSRLIYKIVGYYRVFQKK